MFPSCHEVACSRRTESKYETLIAKRMLSSAIPTAQIKAETSMKKTHKIVIGMALVPALNLHTAKAIFVAFDFVHVGYSKNAQRPGTYRGAGIAADGTLYGRAGLVCTSADVSLFMVVFSGN